MGEEILYKFYLGSQIANKCCLSPKTKDLFRYLLGPFLVMAKGMKISSVYNNSLARSIKFLIKGLSLIDL